MNSLEQENNFLKEMIRTYYKPTIEAYENMRKEAIEYVKEFTFEPFIS